MRDAREVLASQPFSQLLGAELESIVPGRAELRVSISQSFLQQHGFVHGGVISYLADNALTFAGGSVLGDAVTGEFRINYSRPSQGDVLIAMAEVVTHGRRQAVCTCRVVSQPDSVLVALAKGTIASVSCDVS